MAKIVWDKAGERRGETGVDHGVLYLPDDTGKYSTGVAWNGLTAVNEEPTGAEPQAQYADNIKYLVLMSTEEWAGTIEAMYYPDEFEECDGSKELVPGVTIGQQNRKNFGFSYRTLVVDDIKGQNAGYKINIVYGCLAAPSSKNHSTVNDSPELTPFSWSVTSTPVDAGEGNKPTATLTVDSTEVPDTKITALEDILYGAGETEPRLPLPDEVATILT